MKSHICLLLDKACRVMLAVLLRGTVSQVTDAARRLIKEKEAWGYEIWHDKRRVASFYDCKGPPSRIRMEASS